MDAGSISSRWSSSAWNFASIEAMEKLGLNAYASSPEELGNVIRTDWPKWNNAVKAAEISLAKPMSQQLARDNIRVNSVAPGSISFPGGSWHTRQQQDPEGMAEFVRRELPFGRFGRADEVGAVVAFLASPRASWISGASVPVDGCQSRMF